MRLVDFRDSCVISRELKDQDGKPIRNEWDEPTRTEIYNGACLYEEGGASYTRIFTTRNPTIYIPLADGSVQINDSVVITTEFGRVLNAVVKIVRDVNMPWQSGIKVTKIELKQAQGD